MATGTRFKHRPTTADLPRSKDGGLRQHTGNASMRVLLQEHIQEMLVWPPPFPLASNPKLGGNEIPSDATRLANPLDLLVGLSATNSV